MLLLFRSRSALLAADEHSFAAAGCVLSLLVPTALTHLSPIEDSMMITTALSLSIYHILFLLRSSQSPSSHHQGHNNIPLLSALMHSLSTPDLQQQLDKDDNNNNNVLLIILHAHLHTFVAWIIQCRNTRYTTTTTHCLYVYQCLLRSSCIIQTRVIRILSYFVW